MTVLVHDCFNISMILVVSMFHYSKTHSLHALNSDSLLAPLPRHILESCTMLSGKEKKKKGGEYQVRSARPMVNTSLAQGWNGQLRRAWRLT